MQVALGAEPCPPWLLTTVAVCLLAEPVLPDVDWLALDSCAASATSILPPNWKLFVLTWVLLLVEVAVSHEHTCAAAWLSTWVSGLVMIELPVVARASVVKAVT